MMVSYIVLLGQSALKNQFKSVGLGLGSPLFRDQFLAAEAPTSKTPPETSPTPQTKTPVSGQYPAPI
jgi:hypothetical protein